MATLLIALSSWLHFAHAQAGFSCNAVQIGFIDYRLIDVCLAEKTEQTVQSSKYSCSDDGSQVNFLTYYNSECLGTPVITQTFETDAARFECQTRSVYT